MGRPDLVLVEQVAVREAVAAAVAAHRDERGPLLPVLHEVVVRFGYLPEGTVHAVAEELNLSRAEVHGVISFYHDLRTEPPGRVVVAICRAEACQAVGGRELLDGVCERLGVPVGSTGADGAVSLEEVFCLGNCALGPSAMVQGRLHGRLTVDRLCALVEGAS
jgi:formate dehydrogenase subunit gamma